MTFFWLDQAAIAAVLVMSGYYVSRMQFSWTLVGLLGAIAGLSWYLCYICTWDRSYPVEHGCLHGLVSAVFHTILCSF